MTVEHLFEELWSVYTRTNPNVLEVHRALKEVGAAAPLVNDHIALRTLQHPQFGIERLARAFFDLGYEVKGRYRFEEKKLDAMHLEHASNARHPKVFISELCVSQCSQALQDTLQSALFDNLNEGFKALNLTPASLPASGAHWGTPSYEVYKRLLD